MLLEPGTRVLAVLPVANKWIVREAGTPDVWTVKAEFAVFTVRRLHNKRRHLWCTFIAAGVGGLETDEDCAGFDGAYDGATEAEAIAAAARAIAAEQPPQPPPSAAP